MAVVNDRVRVVVLAEWPTASAFFILVDCVCPTVHWGESVGTTDLCVNSE